MKFWTALFIGIVEGLTEFLPVSGSGHLSIFVNLFKLKYVEEEHLLFAALLQLSVLAAIYFAYKKDIGPMFRDSWEFVTGKGNKGRTEDGRITVQIRTVLMVLIALIPTLVMLLFYKKLKTLSGNTSFVALALLVTGGLLYAADRIPKGTKTDRNMSALDALCIGAAQAIAMIPGMSRPGSAVTAGIARGMKRDQAVRFSFLVAFPVVLVSVFMQIISALLGGIIWKLVPLYIFGAAVAGVIGYFALLLFRRIVSKMKLTYFSYYCWGVGVIVLIVSMFA